jgi:asparagine synthase (glutamine-hydrolysing)
MCGFACIFNYSNKEAGIEIVNSMLSSIVHRGPDNHSIFQDESVIMGFQRLAIIDLQEISNQPMVDETGRFIITYNGEIYNYKHLRSLIEKQGYKFKTGSDTEVLLQMYIMKGKSCLQDLNGMFAFMIYDKHEKKIFLARDRAGKKPLYYTLQKNCLYVASEMKALLAIRDIDKQIDLQMINQYLALGYNLAPDTIIKKIKKLKPGNFISLEPGNHSEIIQETYWQVRFNDDLKNRPINDIEEEFFELLSDSARLRLQSDVPLALFLSGGLDSSAIASILATSVKEPVHAFTIDFDDKQVSELTTVKSLIGIYPNLEHHVLELKSDDMLNNPGLLEQLDEPLSDSSFIPTFWISKLVKNSGFTVALSGDGGDELLAGYFGGKPFDLMNKWYGVSNTILRSVTRELSEAGIFPDKIEDRFRRMSFKKEEYYWYTRSSVKFHLFNNLFKADILKQISPSLNYHQLFSPLDISSNENMMHVFEQGDFKYRLPDGYLEKVDRASMLNSMEVRNPFLDYRIIELLTSIPARYKLKEGQTKYLLRYMLKKRGLVSEEVLAQKKMGFSIPLRNWVHNEMKQTIVDTILSGKFTSWINPQGLSSFFNTGEKLSMHNEYSQAIWSIYILSLYLHKYKISI